MECVSLFTLSKYFCWRLILFGSLYYFIPLIEAQKLSCPQHGQSPVETPEGLNKFCTKEGQKADCPESAICLFAKSDLPRRICCYLDTSVIQFPLICPNNADRRLTKFGNYQCNSDIDCDLGYVCVQATNKWIKICCGSAATSCPSEFTPTLNPDGKNMPCSLQIHCPDGTFCLPAKYSDSKLCCKSNESPPICPDNMVPLLKQGHLETCSAIGPCSDPGYFCKFTSNRYVCCGHNSPKVQCADGREIFQQTIDSTYYCNPFEFPSSCPTGYQCAQSTSSGHVCCKNLRDKTIPTTSTCPDGWNPYRNEVNGQMEFCFGPLDTSCPIGYSCTPSSFIGSFVCCRLASVIQCIKGQTLLANGQPRLCFRSRSNNCPRGYSCEQSTSPTVTVCCSNHFNDERVFCPDGSTPALIHNNVQICPILGSEEGCPEAHLCQSSNKGIGVCCRSLKARLPPYMSSNGNCDNNLVVFKKDGTPLECTYDSSVCPITHPCLHSFDNRRMYCCQHSLSSSGIDVELKVETCKSPSDCKKNFVCQLANQTSGYTCGTIVNTSKSVCCDRKDEIDICPDNRLPVFSARTNTIVYCDETAYTCPSGKDCIQMRNSHRYVCCSSIPRCLTGQPQLNFGTKSALRCDNSFSCASNMYCQQSNVPGVKLCCSKQSVLKY